MPIYNLLDMTSRAQEWLVQINNRYHKLNEND
jgi:hypothetical protein